MSRQTRPPYDFVLKVVSVRQVENEVRHYLEDTTLSLDGKKTKCLLDKDRRILNARYHTAAHLYLVI